MTNKKFSILSFKFALDGIIAALKAEPNLKFHILIGLLVALLSFFLNISRQDWVVVIMIIGFVIAVELTNTSIETVVDHFTENPHPGAKLAKDISAGAVLVSALTAAIVGILIFTPYIFR